MSSLSGKMAQWALDLQFEDIPEKSIWEAKRFLLDSMGCALAAVNNEDMEAMYRFTEKLGGTPEASVIGREYKTNASNAALMNCLLTRAMDYNDIYWEEDPSHPSDLIGTALVVEGAAVHAAFFPKPAEKDRRISGLLKRAQRASNLWGKMAG